ncbi:TetR/AcrR family transcriptional regulator [Mycolicibacterium thermoresistibile]|uniref:TetR family transcriptional regulator n=2 Tax=Mycolicibacterium thermoresistibile TaxID=1797 RepID=G7CH47_MYCT3|nr:TetR/AcrR family transcriptional regulator [Mycolicibacterium thermoresistibile]EHI12157.1 TetR family transcriptional regulator [Mycolicibacterium thermoresistibile ATCC 19527]GAT15524.1 TetR family transcriptional regulator [Mycolicibacterium thermoresistibile]SNW16925.1 TetR family transcriptional regulator [Mycolicibacterium thermoresistibile]
MTGESDADTVADSARRRRLTARQSAGRNEVLRAAAEAFTTRGYAATSIDDIADRLHATKGRVYHYFRTKGDIFIGIHKRALEISFDSIRDASDSDAPASEKLHRMARAHALMMLNEPTFLRLAGQHAEMNLASEGRTPREDVDEIRTLRREYEARFERVIARGIESGEFKATDSYLMAKAVLGTLNWMSRWYHPGGDTDEDRFRIATSIADFVVSGLRPTEADG